MYTGLHAFLLFLSDFNKLEFSRQTFERKTQISNLMEIRSVEPSCSTQTDGETDKTKLIIAFLFFGPCIFNSEYKNKPTKCI